MINVAPIWKIKAIPEWEFKVVPGEVDLEKIKAELDKVTAIFFYAYLEQFKKKAPLTYRRYYDKYLKGKYYVK